MLLSSIWQEKDKIQFKIVKDYKILVLKMYKIYVEYCE
jgi:hypothetical protein